MLYCEKCELCCIGKYNLCEVSNVGLAGDGGFAEYFVAEEKYFHKLPEGVSLEEGALVEPTAVAFHAVNLSNLKAGQSAAIYGDGPIGLLTLLCTQAYGAAEIFVIDLSHERLDKAKELGASHVINAGDEDAVEKIMKITGGRGVDVSYEVAGANPTFNSAIKSIKRGGTVQVIAGFGGEVSFNPNDLLTVEGQMKFSLAYAHDFKPVIKAIADGQLDVLKVVTNRINLDDVVKEGVELLNTDKSQAKVLISPHGAA